MKVITQGQLTMYFALHIFSTIIAFLLGFLLQSSGINSPIGIIVGAICGLALTYITYILGVRRPDKYFVDYGKDIISKWVHYPVLFFIIITNFFVIIIDLWELQDFLSQFYLLNTPPWAIVSFCGLCIAYTARFGIRSIFRTAEGIFFITLLSFLLLPFFVGNNIQWFIVKGFITQFSMREAWPSVYYTTSVFGQMTLILLIFPYLEKPKTSYRSLIYSSCIAVLIIIVHMVPIILVFGPELIRNLNYPELEILRFIKSGSFLETLDPALIALWLISIFVKLSFMVFIVSHIVSRTFKLKDAKPLVFPITFFSVICSLCLAKSQTQFYSLIHGGIMTFFIIAEFFPIVYLIIDSIRGSYRKDNEGEAIQ